MIVAVDTSVLMSIFKQERSASEWFRFLLRLRTESELVACDVVWSEVASLFPSLEDLRTGMARLGVIFSPIDEVASFSAGQLFAGYRRRGGSRSRMIADFMIAAHALEQANGLATADADFTARQFPQLKLLQL
jgi:predicted nucleic acid-binding protein